MQLWAVSFQKKEMKLDFNGGVINDKIIARR